MIFPTPVNPTNFSRFPLTWTLVALNFLLFVVIFSVEKESDNEEFFLRESTIQQTGIIYEHYRHPASQLTHITETDAKNWGMQALRDEKFISGAENIKPFGDSIDFSRWQKKTIAFREDYFAQPTFQYGLSSASKSRWPWITYQFAHASWSHLFSNLVYLIIVGVAVELLIGSWGLLLLYCCGGIAGGLSFLLFNSHGFLPMVGASASITALMAFYAIYEPKVRIRYFYFLSPMKEHYGAIYLPTLLMIPLYLISDWVSFLGSPTEMSGSTAYTAHLGGSVFGALLAILMRYYWKTPPQGTTT